MKKSDVLPAIKQPSKRLRELTAELQELEARLRLGGGPDKIERQHAQGKLTARERIALLLDKDSYAQEVGLLVAYDQYPNEDRRPKTDDGNKVDEAETRTPVAGRRSAVEIGAAPGAGV